jgi:hypothetical protein
MRANGTVKVTFVLDALGQFTYTTGEVDLFGQFLRYLSIASGEQELIVGNQIRVEQFWKSVRSPRNSLYPSSLSRA